MKETGAKLDYQVGTMIELPRAALMADEIAQSAEFFSFGTNDLTQTTFGISRDDAASLPRRLYRARASCRPIRSCRSTSEGVGELVQDRRRARPQGAQEPQGRHLRRARRRSGLGRRSATRSGSTMCRARRSACRSRGSRRRRPRSARRRPARHKAGLSRIFFYERHFDESGDRFFRWRARSSISDGECGAGPAADAAGHQGRRRHRERREAPLPDRRQGRAGDPAARLRAEQPHVAAADRRTGQDPHRHRARPARLRPIGQAAAAATTRRRWRRTSTRSRSRSATSASASPATTSG